MKICNFLGKKLTEEEVDEVVDKATFDKMRKDGRANYKHLSSDLVDHTRGGFLRKGKTVASPRTCLHGLFWSGLVWVNFGDGFRQRCDIPFDVIFAYQLKQPYLFWLLPMVISNIMKWLNKRATSGFWQFIHFCFSAMDLWI